MFLYSYNLSLGPCTPSDSKEGPPVPPSATPSPGTCTLGFTEGEPPVPPSAVTLIKRSLRNGALRQKATATSTFGWAIARSCYFFKLQFRRYCVVMIYFYVHRYPWIYILCLVQSDQVICFTQLSIGLRGSLIGLCR